MALGILTARAHKRAAQEAAQRARIRAIQERDERVARNRVSQARIETSIAAGQARGLTPSSVKFYTDGSYEVLFGVTNATETKVKKPQGNGWNI